MELVRAYWYRYPGEFQAAINKQESSKGALKGWWVTQDGVKLKPYMMRDSHLVKCLDLVEKRDAYPIRDIAIRLIHGQRAKQFPYSERSIAKGVAERKTYILMVKEAIQRGLIEDEPSS
jgi:hypothetical protein